MKIQARYMLSLINSVISMFFDLKRNFLKKKEEVTVQNVQDGENMVYKTKRDIPVTLMIVFLILLLQADAIVPFVLGNVRVSGWIILLC